MCKLGGECRNDECLDYVVTFDQQFFWKTNKPYSIFKEMERREPSVKSEEHINKSTE